MDYFGITSYDPINGTMSSIDPLRSLAISVKLAENIFPGSSGRIWKIRYLSALCFLIQCTEIDESKTYKENYIKFRKYENIFILISALFKNEKEIDGLSGLMGTSKASRLIENSSRGNVDISGEILSNQINLGPLGVYMVILRSLGLIEDDNLVLTNNGKQLANLYRNNLGESATIIEGLGYKNRIDVEKLKIIIDPNSFSFNFKNKPDEAELIFNLLVENPQVDQLFKDVNKYKVSEKEDSEDFYVKILANEKSSLNLEYYKLIFHFEMFQRKLHNLFNFFLSEKIPKKINDYQEARKFLENNSQDLETHGLNFKELSQKAHSANPKDFIFFNEVLDELLSRKSHFEDFVNYLITELHCEHQKAKNKSAWVTIKDNLIITSPSNVRYDLQDLDTKIHRYRFANVDTILNDLNKKDYK